MSAIDVTSFFLASSQELCLKLRPKNIPPTRTTTPSSPTLTPTTMGWSCRATWGPTTKPPSVLQTHLTSPTFSLQCKRTSTKLTTLSPKKFPTSSNQSRNCPSKKTLFQTTLPASSPLRKVTPKVSLKVSLRQCQRLRRPHLSRNLPSQSMNNHRQKSLKKRSNITSSRQKNS